jgi:hypothetical protein
MKKKLGTKQCKHDFKPVDMVDKGQEVHKIYRCECGEYFVEVYEFIRGYYGKDAKRGV